MPLGATQPHAKIISSSISWGKGGRGVGLKTLPLLCADFLEIWEPHAPRTLRASPGMEWDSFLQTI